MFRDNWRITILLGLEKKFNKIHLFFQYSSKNRFIGPEKKKKSNKIHK
jgi:hypothetical protein